MIIQGYNNAEDSLDNLDGSSQNGILEKDEPVSPGSTQKLKDGQEEENDDGVDYFTFTYSNGTIDFNNSMNFDSKKFLQDVKKLLVKIKTPAELHRVKLFFCQAFKIPMDDLTINQSTDKFLETMSDNISGFDVDKMDSDVGYEGTLNTISDPFEPEVETDEPNS